MPLFAVDCRYLPFQVSLRKTAPLSEMARAAVTWTSVLMWIAAVKARFTTVTTVTAVTAVTAVKARRAAPHRRATPRHNHPAAPTPSRRRIV